MQACCDKTKIKEIFSSIQGEGLYVGEKHLFVRFCSCNLSCGYCDTDFSSVNAKEYSTDELYNKIKDINCAAISFTGGEPLCETKFLKNFLNKYKTKLNKKIYLETNGTMYKELEEIINYIDIVSMDIKLNSATGQINRFLDNEKFLKIASEKETFIKIVFDNKISVNEISETVQIAKKYNTAIILQPKMPIDKNIELMSIFDKFYSKYRNIRLIPQTHKFLNLT